MITVIQGPMWAGKTTKIMQIMAGYNHIVAFDCCNTRGSNRDLSSIVSCYELPDILDYSYRDLIVFDEVHLVNVFGEEQDFFRQMDCCRNKDIVLCGLLYDCYNDYEYFPIWDDIEQRYNVGKHIWLRSLKPCDDCGKTDSSVIYTRKVGDRIERVGDDYVNVCVDCARRGI